MVSVEYVVVGVESLDRGLITVPGEVMFICEGRVFNVWISIPEIETIDSCDGERCSLGPN